MFSAKDTRLTRPSGGFVIPRSLRLRASATANLSRTFGTPTSNTTWTFSLWLKRGFLSQASDASLLVGSDYTGIYYRGTNSIDSITFYKAAYVFTSASTYRDSSAWYHIVVSSNGTTVTTYVNGVSIGSYTGTLPNLNSAVGHTIGVDNASASKFDGYIAETNFIDGQALTPTSFGTTNTTTGVWSPIEYTGTYGNNGFHLDFNSYATTAALGTDTSGNSNTWTVNNCSVTAGITYDSMIDVPTVTATGSNYATLNATMPNSEGGTYSNGNLFCSGTNQTGGVSSIAMVSGKWYAEVIYTTGSNANVVGIMNASISDIGGINPGYAGSGGVGYYGFAGQKYISGTGSAYGASHAAGDLLGIEVDMDNNTVQFFKNGTSQGTISTTINNAPKVFMSGNFSPAAHSETWNFGQRPFGRTPTAGFNGLNTYNLAAPSILKGNLYMDATTYTGTGASLGVTNAGGFQPGFVWAKSRSAATDHALYDSVRGTTKQIESNTTTAETTEATGLTAFDSAGFTVGALAQMNTSAATYVGWQWKAGSTVTNTSGTVSAQVSASAASGFSVITYTADATDPITVGHGLGIAPSMYIVKCRDVAGTDWFVYHNAIGATKYLKLNTTAAEATATGVWNNTAPTSTVLTTSNTINTNTKLYVVYAFAQIAGYSAFGSYTGNGSADGAFVYLGFRPRWIMTKQTDGISEWDIIDTARDTYNLAGQGLRAHTSAAEYTPASSGFPVDILSNGFKWRVAAADPNRSGNTYIYAAFAENPFNNSLAR